MRTAGADTTSRKTAAPKKDTVFYNLPRPQGRVPPGWARDVWTWDAGQIQASGATTLAELFADVPGMVPILGGDYGTPLAVSAFGLGGGRVRVIRDGVEVTPMQGGVVDLSHIGLGGIDRVTLERNPGELVIRMQSLQYDDPRPYSLIEAGTGTLNTNTLRGTFAAPTALGGSIALSLHRSGTQGPGGAAPGTIDGSWVRYELHHRNAAGLSFDFRRSSTKTSVLAYPAKSTRTDWSVQGSAHVLPGVVAEAYAGKSIYSVDDSRPQFAREGGSVSQEGVLASWSRGGWWARGAFRHFGDGLPSNRTDVSTGGETRLGGFSAELDREAWPGRATSAERLRAWTAPLLGVVTAFGSWESGTYGARVGPVMEPPLPTDTLPTPAELLGTTFRVTDRTASRFGLEFGWRGLDLSWARLQERADSLLPLGLVFDRAQPALAGGTRTGWEAEARVPTPLHGLDLQGSLQEWDRAWSYLPKRIYDGALVFHNTFMKSGDLEVWARVGVRGRDPMSVRQVLSESTDSISGQTMLSLGQVPFYQDWYSLLQIRIVTVRLFVEWDNMGLRSNLQDVPGGILPVTRTIYGVRWAMWN